MPDLIPEEISSWPGPVALYGFARPRPEVADELYRLLLSFVAPTRAEPGCRAYQVHGSTEDPGVLVFYEHWRSAADLVQHLQQPQMAAFLDRRADLLAVDLELHWLQPWEPAAS
jgi:quinol monooxygenase YgiN